VTMSDDDTVIIEDEDAVYTSDDMENARAVGFLDGFFAAFVMACGLALLVFLCRVAKHLSE
jgi:hypothetical protein